MLRKKIHTVLAQGVKYRLCLCAAMADRYGWTRGIYDVFLYHVICCQFNRGNCHTIALPFIYKSQSADLHDHASVIKQRFRALSKIQPEVHLLQRYANTLNAAAS